MMIVQTDKMSAPSSWERAQHLYEKNIELESKRRKSAQARVPSDPNAWQQIRENYEAIILEDHAFSEKHNVEYALWQLHYRRIEEFRAHFSAALASNGPNSSQAVKGPPRPDRISRIRQQFKTFLSEATGFYHDLILKIRAKYGLPLGYFSDTSENFNVVEKDGKKSADMKKGLISCHRCLIYLGDLARYKGLYGDVESRTREYSAASSYYLQAASLWPSSGNPHHQLAILASYSGDDLVTVYRYFRSLAVENSFSTAKDNLIVAFEKNRQHYSQLPGNIKAVSVPEPNASQTSRVRGREERNVASKDTSLEPNLAKDTSIVHETYKSFCIRFVRLNGILFTRTSLEMFADILGSASSCLNELISSGPEEDLRFGNDPVENGLLIVRLVAVLIFTVHNAKRETEGQTYAEIVQRAVVLQNAFTATYDIMGQILERCEQLRDPSSSYLLPGILVFLEWLACCPDIVSGTEMDEKQATVRSKFWSRCISFINKLLSVGQVSIDDDEDETCFQNIARYEEGETENRIALWEDIELRGFLPLIPAQTILDFSRKHPLGSDGSKEKKCRMKRILAAGKVLANIVRIDQKPVYFDSKEKKFVIGVEPRKSNESMQTNDSNLPMKGDMILEDQTKDEITFGVSHENSQLYAQGEDEDEVILFRPSATEKNMAMIGPDWAYHNSIGTSQNGQLPVSGVQSCDSSSIGHIDKVLPQSALQAGEQIARSAVLSHPQLSRLHAPSYTMGEERSILDSLGGLKLMENGHTPMMRENMGISQSAAPCLPFQQSFSVVKNKGVSYNQLEALASTVQPKTNVIPSSGVNAESLAIKTPSASQVGLNRNPVSRPVRHIGPPPGFSHVPSKQVTEPRKPSNVTSEIPVVDDYSWLDGYRSPSPAHGPGLKSPASNPTNVNPHQFNYSNGLTGLVNFPFPGKQAPLIPSGVENMEYSELHPEQQMQKQHIINGSSQFTRLPEQGQSVWRGRYFV